MRAAKKMRPYADALAALPAFDEVIPSADGVAATEARVLCPTCGERVSIALDPGSGPDQQYTEDCEVCCRALRLTVRYEGDGSATVTVEREDGS